MVKKTIQIRGFNKSYEKPIFKELNLDIKEGEFIAILGPNGCGKTTLLKAIAGLTDHEGEITKQGTISFVSQDPKELILPWLKVEKNIIFPEEEYDPYLLDKLIQITQLEKEKYPYQLSGGMQQLLLIARALMHKSEIILLDEPFKSLDYEMTKKMQAKVKELWAIHKPTIIMVSHRIEEAIQMADRIIVLTKKPTKIAEIVEIKKPTMESTAIEINRRIQNAIQR